MAKGPDQYFIMPDPRLEGRANLVSATSEQGAFAGPATSDSGNGGEMYPLQSGAVSDTAEDVDYYLQRAGGVGSAEFLYKKATDAGTLYRGKDDPRRLWKFHTPGALTADSNTIVYSRKFRRIICFTENGNFNIDVRYRSIGTDVDYTQWTVASDIITDREIESFDHELAAIELEDGALLLFVRTDNVGGLEPDFDVWRSDDGGVSWVIHSSQLLQRFTSDSGGGAGSVWGGTGGPVAAGKWRVRRSGDYIRLVQVITQNDGGGDQRRLSTLVSTDRGVTWTHVAGTWTADQVDTHGGSDDQYPFDFVSTNPASGEFILMAKGTGASNRVRVWSASGKDQWTLSSDTGQNSPSGSEARSIALVNDGTHILQLLFYTRGGGNAADNWSMRRFNLLGPGNILFAADWEQVDDVINATGFRHVPIRTEMVVTGEGIAVQFAVADQQSSYLEETRQVLGFLDVWTRRSLGESGPGQPLVDGTLFDYYWAAWSGRPAPTGNSQVSNDTLWTENLALSPTITSNQEFLDTSTNAVNERVIYELDYNADLNTLGAAGAAYQANGSVWGWVAKVDTGDGDDQPFSGKFIHTRIVSTEATVGGSNGVDFDVRIDFEGASVYDNHAGSYVGGVASGLDLDGAEHEYRVFVIDLGASVVGYLTFINLHTGVVTQSAQFTLQENFLGSPANTFQFGIDDAQVGATTGIEWREIWMMFGKGSRENNPTNPDDQLGALCKSVPQFVEQGIEVQWVGAGGAEADSFSGTIGHAYAAENILVGSPRVVWRSTGISDQTLIFDADPENGIGRFFHNAVAVFGIVDGSVTIDYDNDVNFGFPLFTTVLEPKVFTGLSVGSVRGDTIFLNALEPRPSVAAGMIAEWISGAASGERMLCTLHWDASTSTSYLSFFGEDLGGAGVAGGDQFDLYEVNAASDIGSGTVDGLRYMRLRFTDNDTHTGDHRLGTLIAGQKLTIDVPLDWQHNDNEQPNVTSFATRSAISWAYEEGPPQRTFTGRIVGDANRWREKFRDFLRSFVGYELHPIAFIMDDTDTASISRTVMLGRIRSGSQQDNAAWYKDSNQVFRTAGDQSVTFVEEV